MDNLSKTERAQQMALVRSKDTKPEMRVRRLVHALGFRFRLHRRELPGCPDLVFVAHKKVIFVHGCFWHRHNCPLGNRTPKSRVAFWTAKFEGNRKRDSKNYRKLKALGWRILVVWECQTQPKNISRLTARLLDFLHSHQSPTKARRKK